MNVSSPGGSPDAIRCGIPCEEHGVDGEEVASAAKAQGCCLADVPAAICTRRSNGPQRAMGLELCA